MKRSLTEEISLLLLKEGFLLKTFISGFDILARKGERTLFIKVVKDVNSVNPDMISQMKNLASYIDGAPLIVAESAGIKLEDNVVYSRAGVATVNLETFRNCIQFNNPFFRASNAGITAAIDGKKLKKVREDDGYSINSLSKKIGVSNKMVKGYEHERCEISYAKALKIYDLFGEDVFHRWEVLSTPKMDYLEANSDVSLKYASLGFNVLETVRTPFDIVARKNDELILTAVGNVVSDNLASLSKMLDTDNLLIFKDRKPKIESPVIAKEEFLEFEKADEVLKFVKEF